jgi:spore maturation protein CgeB
LVKFPVVRSGIRATRKNLVLAFGRASKLPIPFHGSDEDLSHHRFLTMRVLYGGNLGLGTTTEHRLRAFRRSITQDLIELPFEPYLVTRIARLRNIYERVLWSPGIMALNRALSELVDKERPDWVWLDKPVYFHADTIARIARRGVKVVSYMPDDPFGPRGDFGWRLFKAALPHYWAHVVTREVTRAEFLERGATRVACVPFAFEPSTHFPPSALGIAPPKDFDVSFVGSPYDERAEWIIKLVKDLPGLRFGLFGPGWKRHAARLRDVGLTCRAPVWNDQYREVIWRSKLSLSFVTRSNRDECSHKALEIAASGTAVLVEPSPVHSRVFRERESAYFFEQPGALSRVVCDALAASDSWRRVGARGAEAVRSAQLSNDEVLRTALRELNLLGMSAGLIPVRSARST